MNNEWLTQSAKSRISTLLWSCFSESAERILKRKASLSKGILKRTTAKIFVSRSLELSLKKTVQIFVYLISEVLCNIYSWLELNSNKHARKSFLEKY